MSGSPLSDSREAVVNAVVDSLGAYKKAIGSGRGMMPVPMSGHLRHFPLFALAMLKHVLLYLFFGWNIHFRPRCVLEHEA